MILRVSPYLRSRSDQMSPFDVSVGILQFYILLSSQICCDFEIFYQLHASSSPCISSSPDPAPAAAHSCSRETQTRAGKIGFKFVYKGNKTKRVGHPLANLTLKEKLRRSLLRACNKVLSLLARSAI